MFRQGGDLCLYDIPKDVGIQAEIFMSDDIPQTGYLTPGNFNMFFFETFWHLPRRFTNDLEAENDCQAGSPVALECVP